MTFFKLKNCVNNLIVYLQTKGGSGPGSEDLLNPAFVYGMCERTFHYVLEQHRCQVGDDARGRVQSGNGIYLDQEGYQIFGYQKISTEQLKGFRAIMRSVLGSLYYGVNTLAHSWEYQFVPCVSLANIPVNTNNVNRVWEVSGV